ncbi:MAG: hypothetical protein GXP58_10800, partial [Deltaproteobacteria bacterium]|nr:hypothetical protein [Deltaproteobacteria bacterium]
FISLLIFFPTLSFAHAIPQGAVSFTPSRSCKGCHPAIFEEWNSSIHARSSLHKDPAHRAVYRKFIAARKKAGKPGNYHCGSCHTPMAKNLKALMSGKAQPDPSARMEREGVGCTFCHRIEAIIHRKNFNRYRISRERTFAVSSPSGKAPHKTRGSALFAKGRLCMGCHSHMVNPKGTPICVMKTEGAGNCLSCHMEKKEGAPAVGSAKKTHRSHFIMGGHDPEMLKKSVNLSGRITTANGKKELKITLANRTPHSFPATNPMRMAFLRITARNARDEMIWSNFSKGPMEDKQGVFLKAFAAGTQVGVPAWKADRIAFDKRLKAGEKRHLTYRLPAETEKVTLTLFYRLFTPKAIRKLAIPAVGLNGVAVPIRKLELHLRAQ